MSLDLSWDLLDERFTTGLSEKLNDVLGTTKRPDYLGPITLSSLALGSEAPEVEIVDVGDVWPEFLQQDDGRTPDAAADVKASSAAATNKGQQRDRRGHSVPGQHSSLTRFANQNLPFGVRSGTETPYDESVYGPVGDDSFLSPDHQRLRRSQSHRKRQQQFQSYRQYSDSGRLHRIETGSMASGYNGLVTPWSTTTPGLGWGSGSQPASYFSAWQGAPLPSIAGTVQQADNYEMLSPQLSRAASWQRQSSASPVTRFQQIPRRPGTQSYMTWDDNSRMPLDSPYDRSPADEPSEQTSSLPSLQLQLSLSWTTQSLRVTLNTSLLINHPSPAFMSLPLTITITGIAMQAGGLLAFEVDQITNMRRAHFCLTLEDEDEEPSFASSMQRDHSMQRAREASQGSVFAPSMRTSSSGALGLSSVPHPAPPASVRAYSSAAQYGGASGAGQGDAQSSAGERILYSVNLETSVGQEDKHVLKNVAKVERFVVTLVRKAITDELVFPNFYSIELP